VPRRREASVAERKEGVGPPDAVRHAPEQAILVGRRVGVRQSPPVRRPYGIEAVVCSERDPRAREPVEVEHPQVGVAAERDDILRNRDRQPISSR
jgi:hypothetical protein